MLAPKIRSVGLVVVADPLLLVGAVAAVRGRYIHRVARIRAAVFKNPNVGKRRRSGKGHRNGVGSGRRRSDVLGVVDGLRKGAADDGGADRARVCVSAVSVTVLTLAVLLFHPTTTTLRSPAVCAAVKVTHSSSAMFAAWRNYPAHS